jgi:hypothetical protein
MTMTARITRLAAAASLALGIQSASAATLTFTELTGVVDFSTRVFRADLTGLGLTQIGSITITDSNSGTGGSGGGFSGFDLDAVTISSTLLSAASGVTSLVSVADLDIANAVFTPGTQRAPADPTLYGVIGGIIDNSIATLNSFDETGWLSLGDGGSVTIPLLTPITVSGSLYIYIGEVGTLDTPEAATGSAAAPPPSTAVPEPMSLGLFGLGLLGLGLARRRRG